MMIKFSSQNELIQFVENLLGTEGSGEIAERIVAIFRWDWTEIDKDDISSTKNFSDVVELAEKSLANETLIYVTDCDGEYEIHDSLIDVAKQFVDTKDRHSDTKLFEQNRHDCEKWNGDENILAREWIQYYQQYSTYLFYTLEAKDEQKLS